MAFTVRNKNQRSNRIRANSSRSKPAGPVSVRNQPSPVTPQITKQMVREHASRMFRDRSPGRLLSLKQWRMAEEDLVRMLEAEAL